MLVLFFLSLCYVNLSQNFTCKRPTKGASSWSLLHRLTSHLISFAPLFCTTPRPHDPLARKNHGQEMQKTSRANRVRPSCCCSCCMPTVRLQVRTNSATAFPHPYTEPCSTGLRNMATATRGGEEWWEVSPAARNISLTVPHFGDEAYSWPMAKSPDGTALKLIPAMIRGTRGGACRQSDCIRTSCVQIYIFFWCWQGDE